MLSTAARHCRLVWELYHSKAIDNYNILHSYQATRQPQTTIRDTSGLQSIHNNTYTCSTRSTWPHSCAPACLPQNPVTLSPKHRTLHQAALDNMASTRRLFNMKDTIKSSLTNTFPTATQTTAAQPSASPAPTSPSSQATLAAPAATTSTRATPPNCSASAAPAATTRAPKSSSRSWASPPTAMR